MWNFNKNNTNLINNKILIAIIHQRYIRRKKAYLQYQKNKQIKFNKYTEKSCIMDSVVEDQDDVGLVVEDQDDVGLVVEDPFFEIIDIYASPDEIIFFK